MQGTRFLEIFGPDTGTVESNPREEVVKSHGLPEIDSNQSEGELNRRKSNPGTLDGDGLCE